VLDSAHSDREDLMDTVREDARDAVTILGLDRRNVGLGDRERIRCGHGFLLFDGCRLRALLSDYSAAGRGV
jgi:hypothetical protein